MNSPKITVLIVEDSPVAVIILKRILATAPMIQVVGVARTGLEALELIPQTQPQVICTDLHMPAMDGLTFTREVMARCPTPILVISASVQAEDTTNVFELLEAGAVDVFPKPTTGLAADYERLAQDLISKIKVLAGVKVFTRHRRAAATPLVPHRVSSLSRASVTTPPPAPAPLFPQFMVKTPPAPQKVKTAARVIKVIAIGASTGGPQALHTILSELPAQLPVPVICVQHISDGFLQGLVNWLGYESKLPVKIAQAGEVPQAGTIYFPPERHHLELDIQGRFVYSTAPAVGGHRPSVTVTFNSVARFYGANAAGVLLTGMGRDGADGMQTLFQKGSLTIAQDESSCVVFGMPKEAIALGAAQYVLSIQAIAPFLLQRI